MSAPLIISVSGLRGEIGRSLTPDVAVRYALAFARSLSRPGPLVITRDGRQSGALFADAVHAALNAAGRDTLDAGVAATPTAGVLIRSLKAAGGIQISASHNPKQFNGLKLFSDAGRVIPKHSGEAVLEIYRQLERGDISPSWVSVDRIGKREAVADTVSAHLAAVLATVDVERIAARKFRVLLDSNHGAGSILGKILLERLGCDVTIVGGAPDGQFEHTPEPTAENLVSILQKVRDAGADVGFCQDPDADRLALIDADGRYPGEEYTVAICARHQLSKQAGPVVINCATSRMTIDAADSFGVACRQSPVGEANVVDEMLAANAVFGGEGNGGPIDPKVGPVRDSFVGMAIVLDAMASSGRSLAELTADFPSYSILKQKMELPREKIPEILDLLARKYADRPIDRRDGIRIDFPKSWALVRASNTEPIVRVIVEAEGGDAARALCDEIQKEIKAIL